MQRLKAGLWAAAAAAVVGASFGAVPARAQGCPGNPDALGTSRVLAVDYAQYQRLGRMQYPESLPLADKEVVLTFDDGPLPPYSNQILDILAAQCVKATYFLVGSMARAYPAVVRREYEEGHTIGTHSENHPTHFGTMPNQRMQLEIDAGISDVGAALGDAKYLAPFFRIPGLERSDTVENELAARSLVVFSSDTVADDWHRNIKPDQIAALALSRLEARGKGILLLHDIHPKTVAALPAILKGLKDKGFHIVQVVPSDAYEIAMANKPASRMLASAMPDQLKIDDGIDGATHPAWPATPPETSASLTPEQAVLPAPDPSAFDPESGVEAESDNVHWPEQPKATAVAPGRHKLRVTSSMDHDRRRSDRLHAYRHARADAEGKNPDLFSRIRAFAKLSTPAH